MPLLTLHLPKSCSEAIMRVSQIITYAVREKGIEYKGEQRYRTMIQALEQL